ncbi:hypothetical protein [Phytoactinopolyspora mesophila]|uniref:Uncharacterized protein n=1 Tax=Phytoactinopolyspora mesophila TaxID=2650750 RepID=A0A7K3M504_9ACTN|nr:hypothetical protein [Phytoactinopolyspora mesophila]NDL57508.1 hypothetical protein [Phytoactinopolyspora mesophila]
MYTPAATFRRTPAERADQQLAWDRSDQAFFAAGACHILAWAFAANRPTFQIVALRKVGEKHPSHVIATNGIWAFDHDGWTLESELMAMTAGFEPSTPWERFVVTEDLTTFCQNHDHRPPHLYAEDPRPRAVAYIATFPPTPLWSPQPQ